MSASLPVEDKPGFTPWPLARRLIPASEFSGPLGPQFGVDDEECRGRLKGDIGKCWRMTEATVDVSCKMWGPFVIGTELPRNSLQTELQRQKSATFRAFSTHHFCRGQQREKPISF